MNHVVPGGPGSLVVEPTNVIAPSSLVKGSRFKAPQDHEV
jgi:hypothetical protein